MPPLWIDYILNSNIIVKTRFATRTFLILSGSIEFTALTEFICISYFLAENTQPGDILIIICCGAVELLGQYEKTWKMLYFSK